MIPERMFYGQIGNHPIHMIATAKPHPRSLATDERRLGQYILPPFQRQPVWTLEQKVRLIESLYMGLPIGAIVVNLTGLDSECDGWLLDGQQRLSALLAYLAGEFAVDSVVFPDLTDADKAQLHRISITVIETDIRDRDMCYDIYRRLAYGGTAHEQEDA